MAHPRSRRSRSTRRTAAGRTTPAASLALSQYRRKNAASTHIRSPGSSAPRRPHQWPATLSIQRRCTGWKLSQSSPTAMAMVVAARGGVMAATVAQAEGWAVEVILEAAEAAWAEMASKVGAVAKVGAARARAAAPPTSARCRCPGTCPRNHTRSWTHSRRRLPTSSMGRPWGIRTRLLHSESGAARARAAAAAMEAAAARAVGWTVAVHLEAAEAARAEMAGQAVSACGGRCRCPRRRAATTSTTTSS
eukprot:6733168-Prymnesium_polylepis.1